MANVDWQVYMTHALSVPSSSSVGTDGLGPCLGVIIRESNRIICIHLSCSKRAGSPRVPEIGAMGDITTLTHKLWTSLAIKADGIWTASGQPDNTTKAMDMGTFAYYGVKMKKGFGIYWKAGQCSLLAGWNENITPKLGQSENSTNGPFDIPSIADKDWMSKANRASLVPEVG